MLRSVDRGPDCLFGFKSRLYYSLGKLPNLLILSSIKHSTYLSATHQGTQADGGSSICNMRHLGWVSSYGLSVWVSSLQKGRKREGWDGSIFDGPDLGGGCPIAGALYSLGQSCYLRLTLLRRQSAGDRDVAAQPPSVCHPETPFQLQPERAFVECSPGIQS